MRAGNARCFFIVGDVEKLGKGFRATFLAAMVYSFLSILGGFFASYYIGAAPGGVTALFAAGLLLVTILAKKVLR